jgi:hypothetical protein
MAIDLSNLILVDMSILAMASSKLSGIIGNFAFGISHGCFSFNTSLKIIKDTFSRFE